MAVEPKETITVRVNPTALTELDLLAAKYGITRSAALRECLRAGRPLLEANLLKAGLVDLTQTGAVRRVQL